MPPSWFTKTYLIQYADEVLDPNMTINEMRCECELRVAELTEEKMIIVRKESIEVDPNPAAVSS
jgi:hypothetical protein